MASRVDGYCDLENDRFGIRPIKFPDGIAIYKADIISYQQTVVTAHRSAHIEAIKHSFGAAEQSPKSPPDLSPNCIALKSAVDSTISFPYISANLTPYCGAQQTAQFSSNGSAEPSAVEQTIRAAHATTDLPAYNAT
jgi:hypothetical protein